MPGRPAAPRRTQGVALEVAEGVGDGVLVDAHGRRLEIVRLGEPVEEGDRFGGREGEVEAGHPLWPGPPGRRSGSRRRARRRRGPRGGRRVRPRRSSPRRRRPPPASSRGTRPSRCSTPRGRVATVRGSSPRRRPPSCRWRAPGLSARDRRRVRFAVGDLADQGQEADLGDQAPAPEADDGELAPGHQLVGEGPGDPEQLAGLGHGEDQPVGARRDGGRVWGLGPCCSAVRQWDDGRSSMGGWDVGQLGDGHGCRVRCGRPRNRQQLGPQPGIR